MIRRRLDAWLLLDKPGGITSNAALQRTKRLFRATKAGHAGTLDPLASGLLPVLFGEATKFAGFLLDADKEYVAEVRLGMRTATGDADGEVIERRAVNVDAARLDAALARFRGEIDQVPPMFSALKQGGRPLYELARQGLEVERATRRIVIGLLELQSFAGDTLRLRVRCSKGTYIRTLASDLGDALGTGAHLTALRRTVTGGFSIGDAIALEALEALDEPARDRHLLPLRLLLRGLPRVSLDAVAAGRFAHGQPVPDPSGISGPCQVLGPSDRLLGVGVPARVGAIRPLRLLAHAAEPAPGSGEAEKTL